MLCPKEQCVYQQIILFSMKMSAVLPVEEHIRLLLEGEAHDKPCDDCDLSQVKVELPPWFEEDKFKRGQKYILRNLTGQFAVTLCGLITVLSISSGLKILINTQKSSSVHGAYRRYASTIKHVYRWYSEDLKPGTRPWKSLSAVRIRHLRSSKISQLRGDGHISQRDLVLTLFGFMGTGLLRPHLLGMESDNVEDVEGYIHFWRTIGYMLGIEDRYNLCRASLQETREVTQYINDKVFKEFLCSPPQYFYHMVVELLNGLWYINITIFTKPFIYFTHRLIGVTGFNYRLPESERQNQIMPNFNNNVKNEVLSMHCLHNGSAIDPIVFYSSFNWFEKMILDVMVITFQRSLFTTLGRLFYNATIYLTMFCINFMPLLGFWKFGIRGYVNMTKEDISLPGVLRTNEEVLELLYQKN